MKENALAMNFEPHECVICAQSRKIGTHKNKAIHSKLFCQAQAKINICVLPTYTAFPRLWICTHIYGHGLYTPTQIRWYALPFSSDETFEQVSYNSLSRLGCFLQRKPFTIHDVLPSRKRPYRQYSTIYENLLLRKTYNQSPMIFNTLPFRKTINIQFSKMYDIFHFKRPYKQILG